MNNVILLENHLYIYIKLFKQNIMLVHNTLWSSVVLESAAIV